MPDDQKFNRQNYKERFISPFPFSKFQSFFFLVYFLSLSLSLMWSWTWWLLTPWLYISLKVFNVSVLLHLWNEVAKFKTFLVLQLHFLMSFTWKVRSLKIAKIKLQKKHYNHKKSYYYCLQFTTIFPLDFNGFLICGQSQINWRFLFTQLQNLVTRQYKVWLMINMSMLWCGI